MRSAPFTGFIFSQGTGTSRPCGWRFDLTGLQRGWPGDKSVLEPLAETGPQEGLVSLAKARGAGPRPPPWVTGLVPRSHLTSRGALGPEAQEARELRGDDRRRDQQAPCPKTAPPAVTQQGGPMTAAVVWEPQMPPVPRGWLVPAREEPGAWCDVMTAADSE